MRLDADILRAEDRSLKRKMSRLSYLDTLAIFHCSRGNPDQAVEIYSILIERFGALEEDERKDYENYDWPQVRQDLEGCRDGGFDTYSQDWSIYEAGNSD